MRHRLFQVDLLKGFAIIAVLLGHTFTFSRAVVSLTLAAVRSVITTFQPHNVHYALTNLSLSLSVRIPYVKLTTFSALTTHQAVPIFMICMGLNYSLSYKRKAYATVSEAYSKNEVITRLKRFAIPFFIAWFASLIVGIGIFFATGINMLVFNTYTLMGELPIQGPGAYFIFLIPQFFIVFPAFYILYNRHNKVALCLGFIIALIFEWIAGNTWYYTYAIVRFLPTILLGLWISDSLDLRARRNSFILILGPISMLYLVYVSQFDTTFSAAGIGFSPFLDSQNLFASFYVSLILLLALKFLPRMIPAESSNNEHRVQPTHNARDLARHGITNIGQLKNKLKVVRQEMAKLIGYLGLASYHIYLLQVIYLGAFWRLAVNFKGVAVISFMNLGISTLNVIICLAVGALWYYADQKTSKLRRPTD